MRKSSSILCTFVFAITIVPWELFDFCPRHVESHEHHGTCNSDMMDDSNEGNKSSLKLNATPCPVLSVVIDDYSALDYSPKLTSSQVALISIIHQLINSELPDTPEFLVSKPASSSDPPLGINALRGPPFVSPINHG